MLLLQFLLRSDYIYTYTCLTNMASISFFCYVNENSGYLSFPTFCTIFFSNLGGKTAIHAVIHWIFCFLVNFNRNNNSILVLGIKLTMPPTTKYFGYRLIQRKVLFCLLSIRNTNNNIDYLSNHKVCIFFGKILFPNTLWQLYNDRYI